MSRKRYILCFILCVFVALVNIYIISWIKIESFAYEYVKFIVCIEGDNAVELQLYYADNGEFVEGKSQTLLYNKEGEQQELMYSVDALTNTLRLDLGDGTDAFVISQLNYLRKQTEYSLDLKKIVDDNWVNSISALEYKDGKIYVETCGEDAYIGISLNKQTAYGDMSFDVHKSENIFRYSLCVAIDVFFLFLLFNINKFIEVPIEIFEQRKLIFSLSKNDLKTRFSGSYLGIFWAFVQPVVTVLVYWFVFQVGLKNGNIQGYPYVLWLVAGLVPWFFFSEAWGIGTNALIEYSYLVKKVVFKIDILPIVKIISSIYVHLFFVCFIMVLCWLYGYSPSLYTLQIFYYIFCNVMLTIGLTYITSALAGFVKDLIQIINIILQIGVWLTPIMWNAEDRIPPKLALLLKLNPVYYIVDGFRDALLYNNFFWDKPVWTMYFWSVCIILFILGIQIFKRLKVHFADVL